MDETPKVAALERVYLRDVWPHEATSFTPWLAENIALLGNCIGAQLEVQGQEKPIGMFRADIIAKDTLTDEVVLIENQVERTDHGHLGQLLTYAAGLRAVTIVWVASEFNDEHRAALDWLNEITSDEVRFFGLEIELWRIGDSAPAPKFNVVCKPNTWRRQITIQAKRDTRDTVDAVHQLLDQDVSLSNYELARRVGCSEPTARRIKTRYLASRQQ